MALKAAVSSARGALLEQCFLRSAQRQFTVGQFAPRLRPVLPAAPRRLYVSPADRLPRRPNKYVVFSWKRFGTVMAVGGVFLGYMLHLRRQKEAEYEKKRRRALGKSKIGGPWQLVNTDGVTMTDKDFLGKWVLIYFGFTHCPDICPDEIEKMVKVADTLSQLADKRDIEPLFFTVDPDRDSGKAVKEYCAEFSAKLRGFTGSKEQVEKVAKTFRVYHSFGPKDKDDDYIVDHTVIMYLIDPEGQFVDYFGQNKKAEEVATQIELQMIKYDAGKRKGWW